MLENLTCCIGAFVGCSMILFYATTPKKSFDDDLDVSTVSMRGAMKYSPAARRLREKKGELDYVTL